MRVQVDTGCFSTAAIPLEDKPPLLVDANGMEPVELALQLLELVPRRYAQILIRRRVVDQLELAEQGPFKIRGNALRFEYRRRRSAATGCLESLLSCSLVS